jgi:cysteine desulfuration protein SufE
MNTQDVIDAFELLDTWDARYEFIGELSQQLMPITDEEREDRHLVPGCNTRTWLVGHHTTEQPLRICFHADAETPLVRGLVALLLIPFQNKTPTEILNAEVEAFLNHIGLREHLSPNRQAGVDHFLQQIRHITMMLMQETS